MESPVKSLKIGKSAGVDNILKTKSNFTLFIYIPFQDICE